MRTTITLVFCFLVSMAINCQTNEPNDITICWDTSISMSERDIDNDLSVLEDFFQSTPNAQVQLLSFALNVKERQYSVINGNWDELKSFLIDTRYDGAVKYINLDNRIKYPKTYIFTNGNRVFDDDFLSLKKGTTIINSCPNRDLDFLSQATLFRGNRLVDFATTTENQKIIEKGFVNEPSEEQQEIRGTIYVDNKRTTNLRVTIKGSLKSSRTDDFGNFSIKGSKGDSLLIYNRNDNLVEIFPIEKEVGVKIFIDRNLIRLDEVLLTEDRKEGDMVMTANGLKDENAVGYGVTSVSGDIFTSTHRRVGDALVGRVAGLNVHNTQSWHRQGLGSATIRGIHSLFLKQGVLVIIDGAPQQRSYNEHIWNYDFLNPDNIVDITVLKSLASTNKYGTLGAAGAILITTKKSKLAYEKRDEKDLALIKDNIYKDEVESTLTSTSPFLKALQSSESENEAYDNYLNLRTFNANNVSFYLDAFDYFKKTNQKLAANVISNLVVLFPENIDVLRTVALSFTSIDFDENALEINDKIIRLSPNNVQAHFDRALLTKKLGLYQEALDQLLVMIRKDRHDILDISGIQKSLEREVRNLIFERKDILDVSKVEPGLRNNVKFDTRLVFEWNKPEAEFEIQIVSPEKRYFDWEHTNISDSERIRNEITQGFAMEEFELYGDEKGQWLINTKYLGEAIKYSEPPMTLKCTVIRNFGTVAQTEYDVLLYFNTFNEKKMVVSLMVD